MSKLLNKITLIAFLLCATFIRAQDPCEDLDRNLITYLGTTSNDHASGIKRIGDFGYMIGGAKFVGSEMKTYIARLDLCGDVIWQKVFDTSNLGQCIAFQFIDESIYAICNREWFTTLIRLDLDGNILSSKKFGEYRTFPRDLITSNDGNFLVVGATNAPGGSGATDIYVIKCTIDGTILWTKRFGNYGSEFGHNIIEDSDGNIVICGYTRDYVGSVRKGFVAKLDGDGNLIWSKEFSNGSGYTYTHYCLQIGDAYYFSGNANSGTFGSTDGLIIKTDLEGNILWSKFIGTAGIDQCLSMAERDGELLVFGLAESLTNARDAVIMEVDLDGNLGSYASFGTSSDEKNYFDASTSFATEEGGFYGYTLLNNGIIGNQDIGFFRFSSLDSICSPSETELNIMNAGMVSNTYSLYTFTPSWSFSTFSFPVGYSAFDSGILCTSILEDDDTCTIYADAEFIASGLSSEDGALGDCYLNAIQFNDLSIGTGDSITDWSWSFGDGETSSEENPLHSYMSAGDYTVTLIVSSELGCIDTFHIDISMSEKIAFDFIYNEPTCYGFSDASITINIIGAVEDPTYEIQNSEGDILNIDNSNTANGLATGWYYLYVSDGTPCYSLDSVYINQPGQLDASIATRDIQCYGNLDGLAWIDEVVNYNGDFENISYYWSPNPIGPEGIGADSTWGLPAGDYIVTINDENGCSIVIDFTISEPDSLYFVEFGFHPSFCRLYDYQNGNGVVFGAVTGGTPDYSYTWRNLDNGEELNNTTWGGLNPGNYELTAVDNNGCSIKQSLYLDSLNPIAAFNIISDQLNGDYKGTAPVEVKFENNSENFANPNDPLADTTFFWNLDHTYNDWQISHDYFEIIDTTYEARSHSYTVDVCLVAINKNGCSDTACKVITIFVPIAFETINIFSPNQDGLNDLFTFQFKSASISEFHCIIVDRWGVEMATLSDITDGWDGTNQSGNACPDGTYFFIYSAIADNGQKFEGQGTVQIAR